MLEIDGSEGEGGGQILRTSLAMSILTGTPVRLVRIRARREKPGLMRQHLTAVQAAQRVSAAELVGAQLGSQRVEFVPRGIFAGEYHFPIGTAGSVGLVLQTVLLPLLFAPAPSVVVIEGGTHAAKAPPFDFLARVYLPLLRRMGADVRLALERPGFYPAGGGRVRAEITPLGSLRPLSVLEAGPLRARRVHALSSRLPNHVAERELKTVAERLGWSEHGPPDRRASFTRADVHSPGPGNALWVELEADALTELFTAVGERGKPAERVAAELAEEVERHLSLEVPVGEHLADQLLLPFCLAGGGQLRTGPLSLHTRTNLQVLARFSDLAAEEEVDARGRVLLTLRSTPRR